MLLASWVLVASRQTRLYKVIPFHTIMIPRRPNFRLSLRQNVEPLIFLHALHELILLVETQSCW